VLKIDALWANFIVTLHVVRYKSFEAVEYDVEMKENGTIGC
jgi:hypothetical protein